MTAESRTYPLKRPEGHVPPVPRWQLVFDDGPTHVHTAYIGVQRRDASETTVKVAEQASRAIHTWIDVEAQSKAFSHEEFDLISGNDASSAHIWVCYWADEQAYKTHLTKCTLESLYASLPESSRASIGVWRENFSIPVTRLETNYTGLDYLPGFAQLPGAKTEAHTLTAYWGAARDRIPDSADDLFPGDQSASNVLDGQRQRDGLGQSLTGTNANNIVFIRSGQFWENCPEEEIDSYERKLEPTLEAGLRYLHDNHSTTGAMGLRYLRNTDTGIDNRQTRNETEKKRKETCVTGFFTSLDKLEGWAKSHKSHLAIYNGAMRHAKTFGAERKFRTWHEVAVLKRGEAQFEYLNCIEGTGLMPFVPLDRKPASVVVAAADGG